MTSILKVDQLQDSGGNAIITSNGAGSITTSSGLNTAIANAGFITSGGITNVQSFQITSTLTAAGNPYIITSNIGTNAGATYSNIGTIVSQSSGVFSFSQTGFYKVEFSGAFQANTVPDTYTFEILGTTDNSTYTPIAQGYFEAPASTNDYDNGFLSAFVNVNNTTNVKIKFSLGYSNTVSSLFILGDTTIPRTFFNFIRLGDSV